MKVKIVIAALSLIVGAQASAQSFHFKQEGDIGKALGMFGSEEPLIRKQLGTGGGKNIIIDNFYVWSFDPSGWEKGGKLNLINDDSMGRRYRIICSVSASIGDKFMADRKRRDVAITGKIKSFSSSSGMVIDPCNASW